MKKLYSSQDRVKIYLLKASLESQGIACFIKNENPPLAGEIPPMIAWPELWGMDDKQTARASTIIEDELSRLALPQQAWVCAECGENLEGQFEQCWKCGAARPNQND
jgi:hypothetical protein